MVFPCEGCSGGICRCWKGSRACANWRAHPGETRQKKQYNNTWSHFLQSLCFFQHSNSLHFKVKLDSTISNHLILKVHKSNVPCLAASIMVRHTGLLFWFLSWGWFSVIRLWPQNQQKAETANTEAWHRPGHPCGGCNQERLIYKWVRPEGKGMTPD